MRNDIKVDVALITKNHESYIEDAVNSLLDQSIPLNRINIVDDASTDATNDKLQKIAKKNQRISLITNTKSLGPSGASNLSLRDLEGDYVLYTSGDDISNPNRAEIQTSILRNNPNSNCVINQVNLIIQSENLHENQIPKFKSSSKTGLALFEELFWTQNFLNASAACFRLGANSIPKFDESLIHLQDYKLWMELCLKNEILINSEIVLGYRVMENSLSQKVNHFKLNLNDSNEELFVVFSSFFDRLDLVEIINIFNPFIEKFKKNDLSFNSKIDLVNFLLLSHNNTFIHKKVIDQLHKNGSDSVRLLDSFLKKYFFTERLNNYHEL
jgi:glycosyltransferase involved in cell wall biosynthesis